MHVYIHVLIRKEKHSEYREMQSSSTFKKFKIRESGISYLMLDNAEVIHINNKKA
jgi:hypothetical protein